MVFLPVGAVVALVAAARSTWSPCGLSMLSTITPFSERGRRHRYGVTAGWFLLGALAGGATLGAAAAGLAAALSVAAGAPGPASTALLGIGAALAAAGGLVDVDVFGPLLPVIRRQVDDRWLSRYRPWVYGVGFGWQIGVGLATYLMTAGVLLVVALGVLSGSPAVAMALGMIFGLARGSTVFLTAGAGTPGRLRDLHQALDRFGPPVRRAAVGVQAGAAAGLALAASGFIGTTFPAGAAAAGTGIVGAALGVAVPAIGGRARRPADPVVAG